MGLHLLPALFPALVRELQQNMLSEARVLPVNVGVCRMHAGAVGSLRLWVLTQDSKS